MLIFGTKKFWFKFLGVLVLGIFKNKMIPLRLFMILLLKKVVMLMIMEMMLLFGLVSAGMVHYHRYWDAKLNMVIFVLIFRFLGSFLTCFDLLTDHQTSLRVTL